ncbi:flavin reductase family protein [Veronia pacifica]|uniref:Flavin oxidoreductase n=1 Tax=Veronia pacifica TaxID=1080227 RepID=A0A1C3ESP9_9GAMM|nr:flavin reductase family protein [Veronia pacifica]ODA36234.1 flavin oxidoreductase [Veronia pacifica]
MHWSRTAIDASDDRFRAKFINSLSGFKSANLIGTADTNGNTNLAIVSSVFHIGANPPLIGMIVRPHTVTRDTLENILATGSYTINHVSADIWKQAHQTSARYPKEQSEFEAVGLHEQYIEGTHAPFVKESRLKFALKLAETQTLEINKTVMIIGEITDVIVEPLAVQEDGFIDIELLETVAVSSLDAYHRSHRLGRLSYAKPDVKPDEIG